MSPSQSQNNPSALPQVGAHVSTAGGHHKGLDEAQRVGCEIIQFFTKNNMQWESPPLREKDLELFHAKRKEYSFSAIFGHSGYLINLAGKPDSENLEKSRRSLLLELERCDQLDFPFLVLHPGAHLGQGEETGLQQILQSLDWVFERYTGPTKIALETTAGQGSNLGADAAHLGFLYRESEHRDRLVFCLDTCHLFAAGYDLRGKEQVDQVVKTLSQSFPWERVVCVHLNDSVGDLGSRKDRHALLGQGKIGWEAFDAIIAHPAFANIPLCLETPKGTNNANDVETLKTLKQKRQALGRRP